MIPPTDDYLVLSDLRKTFPGGSRAVDGLSLAIREGEFVSMLGASGSGKTSTLRMIAGFEAPTSGDVILAGQSLNGVPPNRRPVNTVFQDYALFPHLNVRENVEFGLRAAKVPRDEIRSRVSDALELVSLEGLAERRTDQLSGGQRQRVALTRALILRPRVLLLDEPLGALDLKLRQQMQGVLTDLCRRLGTTFLYVTHDQDEALAMSDRVALLRHGRLEQFGTPAELYQRPASLYVAGFVGESNRLPGQLVNSAGDGATIELLGKKTDTAKGRVDGLAAGAPIVAVVRPEDVRIHPASQGGDGTLGVIIAITFLGADARVVVGLPGSLQISARMAYAAAAAHRVGDDVRVDWDPHDVLAFPAGLGANHA